MKKPLVLKLSGETIGEAFVDGPLIEWRLNDNPMYDYLANPKVLTLAVDAGDVVLLLSEVDDINFAIANPMGGGPQ